MLSVPGDSAPTLDVIIMPCYTTFPSSVNISPQFSEQVLSVPGDSAPTLEMECEVDEMEGEQTWPTEDDVMQAEQARRLPAGE